MEVPGKAGASLVRLREREVWARQHTTFFRGAWWWKVGGAVTGSMLGAFGLLRWGQPGALSDEAIILSAGAIGVVFSVVAEYGWNLARSKSAILAERLDASAARVRDLEHILEAQLQVTIESRIHETVDYYKYRRPNTHPNDPLDWRIRLSHVRLRNHHDVPVELRFQLWVRLRGGKPRIWKCGSEDSYGIAPMAEKILDAIIFNVPTHVGPTPSLAIRQKDDFESFYLATKDDRTGLRRLDRVDLRPPFDVFGLP